MTENRMSHDRIVLVTGATGRQGGATLRHLLARGWRVRALTRSPDSARARALAAVGVEVVGGDLDDRASLDSACRGVHGVFGVQDPWLHGVPREILQGKALADAAHQAGVRHFVYASVAMASEPTHVPHFESKGAIERHITSLGLDATFLRPVFFMDMLLARFDGRAKDVWGALWRGLGRHTPIQLIAVDDIGAVAADAFCRPDQYVGSAVELAGDELTLPEMDAAHRRILGEPPQVRSIPFWLMRLLNREAEVNFRWIGAHGWHVDLDRVRSSFPRTQRFETWLTQRREESLEAQEEPTRIFG